MKKKRRKRKSQLVPVILLAVYISYRCKTCHFVLQCADKCVGMDGSKVLEFQYLKEKLRFQKINK